MSTLSKGMLFAVILFVILCLVNILTDIDVSSTPWYIFIPLLLAPYGLAYLLTRRKSANKK